MTEKIRRAPVRTCLGCRQRDEQSRLLRVVGVRNGPNRDREVAIQPDPARREPGRGAYVHSDLACVKSAEQRRAFGRALRLTGNVEFGAVMRWIEQHPAPSP
ncbi:MAG: YlxR family protein [Ornithinimicrobium sp.]